ncbi:MAG: pyrophosphatase [Sphingomonadales bacterium]|nr:MAG: pyrophosphatase [Sphingomonadales bacterium]
MTEFEALTLDGYAAQAAQTDQRRGSAALSFALLGLFGETGSLLSVAKKKQRDRASYLGYADAVVEELGDVLWYLSSLARRSRIPLSAVGKAALDHSGANEADAALNFHALQPAHMPLIREPTVSFERTLLQLAGGVGELVRGYDAAMPRRRQDRLRKLADVMRCLIGAATEAGVTLEAAAVKNLHKIFDRWPNKRDFPPPFDDGLLPEETLPRQMTIDLFERQIHGKDYVFQRSNGVYVGDRLTDNSAVPDDYRFHDVFHYAYAAVLGWSPVLRSLLRLKRKSLPAIDEAEDGARAILIEEGITSWLFGQAQQLRYFDGVRRGELPLDMLKGVREFVAGYEAERCPLWLWEEAILEGYAAFRFLCEKRQGRVMIDFKNRRLRVREMVA